MRLCRLLVLLLAVMVLAACARAPARQAMASSPYVSQQAPSAVVRSDLDALMYGPPPAQSYYRGRYQTYPSRTMAPAYAPMRQAAPVYAPAYAPMRQAMPVRQMVPVDDGPYTLDAGDRLRIVVFGQDTLSNTYTVDAAGFVSMPLIGLVTARGVTTSQLSSSIAGRLSQSFIRDPSVAVEVETYRPFFVLGEVTYPGQYPYVPSMTVENAVAIAGGFTPRASKVKVTVTRKIQGMPGRFALPLHYPLKPGDVVTVSERWF
jgi:polysaccharide export outer membrane protein